MTELRDEIASLIQAGRYGGKVFPASNMQDFREANRIVGWLEENGYGKQQEPEWEYGATHVDPDHPVSIRDTLPGAQEAQEFYNQIISGRSAASGKTYPASNVYRRAKAVPAGPWEPVQ